MTTYLLDLNLLIALIDPDHVQHATAHTWFQDRGRKSWATCPLTENGVLRIVSQKNYPNSLGSPAMVAPLIGKLRGLRGHVFWPDDLSLLSTDLVDASRLLTPDQITDSYLLALCVAHGGKLATLDRRLVADAVIGGREALEIILP